MNEKKTAEEFLLSKVGKLALSGLKWKSLADRKERIIEAMQEYAAQETAALREENERLKEALKELIPIAMEAEQGIIGLSDRKRYQAQVRIENAKKLIGQL